MNYTSKSLESQQLTLSISTKLPNSKAQAGTITEFKTIPIDLEDEKNLRQIFSTYNYSFNYWGDQTCSKKAYKGMFGIILDVDEGMTIDEAKETYSEYRYIIHTSTSHQIPKGEKPACDRYRIIFPFNPEKGMRFTDPKIADAVYTHMKEMFDFADPAVFDLHSKFYPFLGEPDKYDLWVNAEGEWFDIDEYELQTAPAAAATTATTPSTNRQTIKRYLTYETEIIMPDKRTKHTIESIRNLLDSGKQICYCPFCNDINSQSASAAVQLTQEGFIQLFCSHCEADPDQHQHVYWEDPVEPGMFMMENKLVRVQKNKNNAYVVHVDGNYIRERDDKYARTYISRRRNIPTADFKIEKYASAEYSKVDFNLNIPDGRLKIEIPSAIQPAKKDNRFIDDWLKGLFGGYAGFVKDWMALYCFTNYKQLPVIVLTGDRGVGKTTFSEVIAEIFPELSTDWSGDNSNFTPQFTKKLLMVEENYINKKSQYQKLKAVTGNAYLTVNEKFAPEYKIRNNIKIIMTTNEPRPLFLVAGEKPTDQNNNNFFIYKVMPAREINPRIKAEILERLGHYIQTELKQRYEGWTEGNARYSIPCPITPLAEDLYSSSQTGEEADAELVAEAVVCGVKDDDYMNGQTTIGGKEFTKKTEFNRICKRLGVRSARSNNEYFKKLQDTGVIAYQETRTKHGRVGFKVLRSKEYYVCHPETQ
jgi:hypothetical protein